jgi:cytochrome b561
MATTTSFTPWRYSRPAIFLHWLLAALIVFMAALGWYMMSVEDEPGGQQWMDLHKSVGLVLAALVLLRVLWRLGNRPAPLPAGAPRWQARVAGLTHGLLYLLMLALPVTGVLGASYSRAGLAFFGLALPRWLGPDRATAHQFFEIHEVLVWLMVVLVVLHVLAALKHLLVDHDQVFGRMWPQRRG